MVFLFFFMVFKENNSIPYVFLVFPIFLKKTLVFLKIFGFSHCKHWFSFVFFGFLIGNIAFLMVLLMNLAAHEPTCGTCTDMRAICGAVDNVHVHVHVHAHAHVHVHVHVCVVCARGCACECVCTEINKQSVQEELQVHFCMQIYTKSYTKLSTNGSVAPNPFLYVKIYKIVA